MKNILIGFCLLNLWGCGGYHSITETPSAKQNQDSGAETRPPTNPLSPTPSSALPSRSPSPTPSPAISPSPSRSPLPSPSPSPWLSPSPSPRPGLSPSPLPSPVSPSLAPSPSPRPPAVSPSPQPPNPTVGSLCRSLSGRTYFVASNAVDSGVGTESSPWTLTKALAHPSQLLPGDLIWVRGGIYEGTFVSRIRGTEGAPISLCQYPGERAILNHSVLNNASILTSDSTNSYTNYVGFEIRNSHQTRQIGSTGSNPSDARGAALTIFGSNNKFVNLILHDSGSGVGFWSTSQNSELYGNLIFYNGWDAPDRGHGHSIYVQNTTGVKRIIDNILFSSFSYGVHAYTEGGKIDNIYLEGNTSFNNGILARSGITTNFLVGGAPVAQLPTFRKNYSYYKPGTGGRGINLDYGAGCNQPTIEDNYTVAGTAMSLDCTNVLSLVRNVFIGTTNFQSSYPNNTYLASPGNDTQVFLRPNLYDPSRATVTIFNWSKNAEAQVNATGFLKDGDAFEVRDLQNVFGTPALTGIYSSAQGIRVPMNLTAVTPTVGTVSNPPVHTSAEFGVFWIQKK